MLKNNQFSQYVKQALLAALSVQWHALCAVSYLIDFDQCNLAVSVAHVVPSAPVSRLSRGNGKGHQKSGINECGGRCAIGCRGRSNCHDRAYPPPSSLI